MYETYVALSPKLSEVSSYIDQGTTLLLPIGSVEGFSRSMSLSVRQAIVFKELNRLLDDKGIGPVIKWHYEDHGYACLLRSGRPGLEIPYPTTDLKLGICLHEIGHFYLGHMATTMIEHEAKLNTGRSIQHQYKIETEACDFAVERMRFYKQDTTDLERFQNDYLRKIQKDLDFVIEMNRIFKVLEEVSD